MLCGRARKVLKEVDDVVPEHFVIEVAIDGAPRWDAQQRKTNLPEGDHKLDIDGRKSCLLTWQMT